MITTTTVITSHTPIEDTHAAVLKEIGEYLELESIEVLSTNTHHHQCGWIHTRIDEVNTVDCEGDDVPMTIVKTVTRHFTEVVAYAGGQVINIPQR